MTKNDGDSGDGSQEGAEDPRRDASFLDEFKPVRIAARDPEDLQVLSALLQDAVALSGDLAWLSAQRRFALVANRYRWEAPEARERVRVGVHFDDVARVRVKGLDPSVKDLPVSILAVSFEPGEPPSGVVRIACAADPASGREVEIALEVEAIEASARDMTKPWPAKGRPAHDGGD